MEIVKMKEVNRGSIWLKTKMSIMGDKKKYSRELSR